MIFRIVVLTIFVQSCSGGSDQITETDSDHHRINESSIGKSNMYHPAPQNGTNTESICGGSIDWKPVESYNGNKWPDRNFVSTNESQVGRLKFYSSRGYGSCSGTMIAPDLFLTAGHCVDPAYTFKQVEMNYQNSNNGTPRDIEWFNVTEVVEDELAGLDYAILRVEGNPGYRFGMTTPAAHNIGAGTQLAIIQHPEGIRKVVDAGTAQKISGSRLYYGNIDTAGGSSGSGVLDNQGNLVAVHTNGGCNTIGANAGVLIRDIAQISPVLKELTSRACEMKPIARYWNPEIKDHTYSPIFEPGGFWGYKFERYEYSVCKNPIIGSTAYRQWWGESDHFYTVNHSAGVQNYLNLLGYHYEHIQGYVHTSAMNGAVPLHRYWNESVKDHFYTIDDMPDGTFGYDFENIEAYVFTQ